VRAAALAARATATSKGEHRRDEGHYPDHMARRGSIADRASSRKFADVGIDVDHVVDVCHLQVEVRRLRAWTVCKRKREQQACAHALFDRRAGAGAADSIPTSVEGKVNCADRNIALIQERNPKTAIAVLAGRIQADLACLARGVVAI